MWLFANAFGYRDNARYLYEYVKTHHPEITAVWISRSAGGIFRAKPSAQRYSLYGLWLQYRAGLFFSSTGMGDFVRFTSAGKTVIQLWHGIPIKKILLDSPESLPFSNGSRSIQQAARFVLRLVLQRYTLVIASSEAVRRRLASAFGLPAERVVVTGYPRHDILMENIAHEKARILYAPTWRPNLDSMLAITQSICNKKFIEQVRLLGYELHVALHPLNMQLLHKIDPDVLDVLHLIENEDINYVLSKSEILITDYSSIALDFIMLDRQVILFTPDIGEYLQERGIYEEFEIIFRENGVQEAVEILEMIQTGKNAFPREYRNRYFQFFDSGARKRIVSIAKHITH